jgi:hypothetical protein
MPALKYPYFVENTSLPFFQGTGYHKGDFVGDIVGYEWDNMDPDGDGKRLWDATTAASKLGTRSFRGALHP